MKNAADIKLDLAGVKLDRDRFADLNQAQPIRKVLRQTGDTRTLCETVRDMCLREDGV